MFSKKKTSIIPIILSLPSNFDLLALKNFLLPILEEEKSNTYSIRYLDDVLRIETDISEKKGVFTSDSIHLERKGNKLIVNAKHKTYDSDQDEMKEESMALEAYKNPIKEAIYSYVNYNFNEGFHLTNELIQSPFLCKLSALQKNSILQFLQSKESVLACLEIQNCKSEDFEIPKKSDTYLLITSKRTCIFISNEHDIFEDISNQKLTHIAKIGRDTIVAEKFECQTELFNDSLFEDLQEILKQVDANRIEKFNDLLFLKNPKKTEAISLIEKGYLKAATETEALKSRLKQVLVNSFLPMEKKADFDVAKLKSFLECIKNEPSTGLLLLQLFEDWKITDEIQYSFLEFLWTLKIENSIHITLWVEDVIASVISEKKKFEKTVSLRKQHIDFLISTQQYERSIPYYEFVIENGLNPDILSLLSDNKIDIVKGEDVEAEHILFIEGIITAKEKIGISSYQEKSMLLKLQPFLSKRREVVNNDENVSYIEQQVIRLFSEPIFNTNIQENTPQTSMPISTSLYDLVVPPSFGKASGFTLQLSSMIASVDLPDHEKLIEFSETINTHNYPQVLQIITTLSEQLSISVPKCYLGRGEYSESIIGIESTPNYMIIGIDTLSESSAQYLNEQELRFVIATELAHVLFKHTRITSQDVWVGARKKGTNLAEIALIALPIVGSIGTLAGKFTDISRFSKVFNSMEQVNNVIDKGQNALSYGGKIAEKIPSKASEKERTLLASSRLMEISADRVGLLAVKNLESAVCAILKLRKDFENIKEVIKQKDLVAYLSEKDDDGSFKNQELTIRIKTLISFYMDHEPYFK
ncbi:hypothetical protein [Cellulophaga baltica]|uniref:hypothetical protein n=1 Tax=Cellulophaga baltica TaxID=76594 RepID=UPI002493FEC0|nr:hypothetical protein [Cellulophaga baltica]